MKHQIETQGSAPEGRSPGFSGFGLIVLDYL